MGRHYLCWREWGDQDLASFHFLPSLEFLADEFEQFLRIEPQRPGLLSDDSFQCLLAIWVATGELVGRSSHDRFGLVALRLVKNFLIRLGPLQESPGPSFLFGPCCLRFPLKAELDEILQFSSGKLTGAWPESFGPPQVCCFSWNWRIEPFELRLLASEQEV